MSAKELQSSARIAERDGDLDTALELYDRLIDQYPQSKEAQDARFDVEDVERRKNPDKIRVPIDESSSADEQASVNISVVRLQGGVKLVDISMPFWSIVVFLIKFAFASIPAGIVLFVFWAIVFSLVGLW